MFRHYGMCVISQLSIYIISFLETHMYISLQQYFQLCLSSTIDRGQCAYGVTKPVLKIQTCGAPKNDICLHKHLVGTFSLPSLMVATQCHPVPPSKYISYCRLSHAVILHISRWNAFSKITVLKVIFLWSMFNLILEKHMISHFKGSFAGHLAVTYNDYME